MSHVVHIGGPVEHLRPTQMTVGQREVDLKRQQCRDAVEQLLARAPRWIRQDLMSNDPLARRRAEETLAAMIAAALASEQEPEISIAPSSEIGSTGA